MGRNRKVMVKTVDPQYGERQELKKLALDVISIKANDFPGRTYTNETKAKIERYEHLKQKYERLDKLQPVSTKATANYEYKPGVKDNQENKDLGINPLP